MIITLKGADFSANNIGTLSSWTVSRVLGTGATYSGVSSVDKGASLSATVTIAEGYELGSAGVTVTMGGVTQSSAYSISGSTITISIASVTGNVVIKVPTKNTSTGDESSGGSTASTTWYTSYAVGSAASGTSVAKADYAGFCYQGANDNYIGVPINAIRLRVSQAGTFTVGIAPSAGTSYSKEVTVTLANPSTTNVQTYTLPETLTLSSGEWLVFGKKGDGGLFYYNEGGTATASNGERMCHHVGTSSFTKAGSAASLTVDAGYVVE